jgi:DNA-binding IclR family transcriptional regulator
MRKKALGKPGTGLKAGHFSPIEQGSHFLKTVPTEENPMSEPKHHQTSIQVLGRMFSLLDALAREGGSVSLKSISEQTGLHPSTAHRILNDLAVGGMVERSGPGAYRLGLKMMNYGNLVRSRLDVRDLAARPMQDLHRQTGQTVSLYLRHDDDALCALRTTVERQGVSVARVNGVRLPLCSHVIGRVLLLDDSTLTLHALSQSQAARLEGIQSDLATLRQQGVLIDLDQQDDGQPHHAVAPVLDDQGRVCASLCLHLSSRMCPVEWMDHLKAASQSISAGMGHLGSAVG